MIHDLSHYLTNGHQNELWSLVSEIDISREENQRLFRIYLNDLTEESSENANIRNYFIENLGAAIVTQILAEFPDEDKTLKKLKQKFETLISEG